MNNRLIEMERRVKSFYRGLDPTNYSIYYELPKYENSIRRQVTGMGESEVNQTFGLLAEETAHYLLRMYQTQYDCEILESTIFEYEKGKTTEIDLMMLTRNMVYIIECKHRSSDIRINPDGSFTTGTHTESPIDQNIGHIRRLIRTVEYGTLVPTDRIINIVFLTLNNCRVLNPTTLFTRKGYKGGFAGYRNLLPLIHKIEGDNAGGKIPSKTLAREIRKISDPYKGIEGRKKHVEYVKRTYGE